MRNLLILLFIFAILACKQPPSAINEVQEKAAEISNKPSESADNQAIVRAFEQKKSDIFVEGAGKVKKLLPDDDKGHRHQKFLVEISAKQVLLFAHNIDLAPRIDDLQVGDEISFRGEYVYNPKGGVVHWTHHNPDGGSKSGWLKHHGKMYE